jgi:hypothetical protein
MVRLTRKKLDALVHQLERDGDLVSEEYRRPNRARDHRSVVVRNLDLSATTPWRREAVLLGSIRLRFAGNPSPQARSSKNRTQAFCSFKILAMRR